MDFEIIEGFDDNLIDALYENSIIEDTDYIADGCGCVGSSCYEVRLTCDSRHGWNNGSLAYVPFGFWAFCHRMMYTYTCHTGWRCMNGYWLELPSNGHKFRCR